ncbi:MAG TPA: GEVED domain-containing protein, partial [Lacipirellulaceae bacterium]
MLAADFGDAPDLGVGTGHGNYNTLLSDNGPRHTIVAGLKLGANVDADSGTFQNATANADDVNGALPDDEDGLTNPTADLSLAVGDQPRVNVRVTNTTGTGATLYGWIDYNADGVFENTAERASISVPNGTNNGIVTLVFPVVPSGSAGTTYARFRLSTDPAAANPTGAANDGEVEDYQAIITRPSTGFVDSAKTQKIASSTGGGPALSNLDIFGGSVVSLGDLDGNGVTDLAVGVGGDSTGGSNRGAVDILFMNANGTVKSSQKIASGTGGGPTLADGDYFGSSVASLGDLNGDGVPD